MAFVQAAPLFNPKSRFLTHHYCKFRSKAVSKSSIATMATGVEAKDDKLFAMRLTHRPNVSELRAKTKSAYEDWAVNEARLLFGGPLSSTSGGDIQGSIQIIRAASQGEADAKFDNDPYWKAGIYSNVEMKEWVCGIRSDPPLPTQLFMIWCVDRPGSLQLRKDTRPRHLDWLKASERQGLVGPFPTEGGACGSLLLIEGKNVDEVREWAQNDPYCEVDLFQRVHIAVVTTQIEDRKKPSS